MASTRGDSPGRDAPIAVASLIGLSGLAFAYEVWLGVDRPAALGALLGAWGLVPREFLRELASPGATTQIVWLTPLTAMFLHGGLLHWLVNAVYLWVFGAGVEARWGHLRFVAFYLACGLAASSLQIASDPDSYLPTIGASGAISGVLGATVIGVRSRRTSWRTGGVAWTFLAIWIVIQIISGLTPGAAEEGGVAWWAHAGGFAAGAGLAGAALPLRSRLRI